MPQQAWSPQASVLGEFSGRGRLRGSVNGEVLGRTLCRGVRKSTWQPKTWQLENALHVVQGASVSARVSLRGGRGGELCSWQAAGHFDRKRNSEPLPHSDSCGVRRRGLLKLGRAGGQGAASKARRASSLRVQKDSPRITQQAV